MKTPKEMGYSMPAEWEKHEGTWLAWPKDPNTFPPDILPEVESAYVKMIDELSVGEEVKVLVDDSKMEARVASRLSMDGDVTFYRIRSADVWMRDYGPSYVVGKDVALVKWTFNAWGRKYDDLLPDEETGKLVAKATGARIFTPGIVLEGGSIDVNGAGCLLTTEQCLLNKNRNPTMSKEEIEQKVGDYIGTKKTVWLGEGIEGDDTDGHIDDIARFVGPRRIVAAVEAYKSDANHLPLEKNLRILEEADDQDGKPFDIVTVPMPPRIAGNDGRLPASHLNFYIGNSAVLVPTFSGDSDKEALSVLEDAFPRRSVVGIDCRALVFGLGTLHCVTQQAAAPR
ncbi:MAG TPA: agmatine deiminase family protein [Nitrososphaerales archaeon]|nr:agmatine deiminase family protein [Nitrososphaerales archaeon]